MTRATLPLSRPDAVSPAWPGMTGPSAATSERPVWALVRGAHDRPFRNVTTSCPDAPDPSWPGLTGPSAATSERPVWALVQGAHNRLFRYVTTSCPDAPDPSWPGLTGPSVATSERPVWALVRGAHNRPFRNVTTSRPDAPDPSWPGLTGPSVATSERPVRALVRGAHNRPFRNVRTSRPDAPDPSWPGLTGPSVATSERPVWASVRHEHDRRFFNARTSHVQPIEQILPSRILCLDQFELPRPRPMLKTRLPLDRHHDVIVPLHENKALKPVARGELRTRTLPVFPATTANIIGHSNIKSPKRPVRHDVNPTTHHDARIARPGLRSGEFLDPGISTRDHRTGMVRADSDPRIKSEDGDWMGFAS